MPTHSAPTPATRSKTAGHEPDASRSHAHRMSKNAEVSRLNAAATSQATNQASRRPAMAMQPPVNSSNSTMLSG